MINIDNYIDNPKPQRPPLGNCQNRVKETKRKWVRSAELRGCGQSPHTIPLKYLLLSLFSLHLLFSPLQATLVDLLPFHAAKAQLPGVAQEMRAPGYWIARHPAPDKLVLDRESIVQLNREIRASSRAVSDLSGHSSRMGGEAIRSQIRAMHALVSGMKLFDGDGNRVGNDFWEKMTALEAVGRVPNSIAVRFAFATSFAHQRIVPSLQNLNKVATDTEFDELQNSGYDIGTPLVIYHESADGNWVFGATSLTTGWFMKSAVGFCSQSEWKAYQQSESFVVVTSSKADLWGDTSAHTYLGYQRMGCRLPLLGDSGFYYKVRLLRRDSSGDAVVIDAFVAKSDVHEGYLPYTPRNAITQAFRMLGEKYGWADMQGDWDCSSLLISIFRCFGIELPRNGANQAKSGNVVHTFSGGETASERRQIISEKATGGITLLNMKGHIVLYLGTVDKNPYVLHDAWAYRNANGDAIHQNVNVIGGTIVSGLDLGTGSEKGSLLTRLLKVTLISR